MDEMINLLTKGIGIELSKKIRIAYYEKKKIIVKHESYNKISKKKHPLVLDLLALGIFHEFVIGPMHGSNNFLRSTEKYGVKSIIMGNYKLDSQFNKETAIITKAFFAIIKKYNIEINQLSIPSVNEFLEGNMEYFDRW